MTSRERVRAAIAHQKPDRTPAAFEAVDSVVEKLMKHYQFAEYSQLLEKFKIDVVPVSPKYIGPKLKKYIMKRGRKLPAATGDMKPPPIKQQLTSMG